MTIEQAKQILQRMDKASQEKFSAEEREAITTIGVAWKTGKITEEMARSLLGLLEG